MGFGDISNGGPDVDTSNLGFNGEYKLRIGTTFGGYFEYASIDDGGALLGDASIRSYGLTAGYETEALDTEAYFGMSDTSPSLATGIDIKDYGVRLGCKLSSQAFVVGALGRSEIAGPGGSVDLDMAALGGVYAFGNQWSAFGGVQRTSLDIVNVDATTYGLGVAYDTGAVSDVPMVLSLELARTRLRAAGRATISIPCVWA